MKVRVRNNLYDPYWGNKGGEIFEIERTGHHEFIVESGKFKDRLIQDEQFDNWYDDIDSANDSKSSLTTDKSKIAELPDNPISGKPQRIIVVAPGLSDQELGTAKKRLFQWENEGGILMINTDVTLYKVYDNKLFEIVTELKEVEGITINE